jgi:polar amino acid transport system permease protein
MEEKNKMKKRNQIEIPGRIDALEPRKTGSVIAGVIVAIIAIALLWGIVTNQNFQWDVVGTYLFDHNVINGIGWTILLTVLSMIVALILSLILAVMRNSLNRVLRGVSWFYIWFFRGTPVYTQLIFWGLFSVLVPTFSIGIPFGPTFWSMPSRFIMTAGVCAVIGLALNESAYLAEIVRAGIEAVDHGQTEAAQALGMRPGMTMRRIILPQAMRIIVPPLGNETIGMLKTTSLVLAVPFTLELQYATNAIAYRIFKPIPLLIVAAIWYLVITTVLMIMQMLLEKHFGKGFRVQPLQSASVPGDSGGTGAPANLDAAARAGKNQEDAKKMNEPRLSSLIVSR